MDLSVPVRAFRRLLLPTFGLPMIAMPRGGSSGSSSSDDLGGGRVATRVSSKSPDPLPLIAETAIGSRLVSQNSAACKIACYSRG